MNKTTTSLALSAALALSLSGCASKNTAPEYQASDVNCAHKQGKKCANAKCGQGSCGEGSCGAKHDKNAEGSCGEGSCGGNHGGS